MKRLAKLKTRRAFNPLAYLGLIPDEKLRFYNHTKHTIQKARNSLYQYLPNLCNKSMMNVNTNSGYTDILYARK